MVIFFRMYLTTAMLKVLSEQLQGTMTTAFERHFTIEDFMDMDQHKCQACTQTYDIWFIILHASFSQTSLFFKFNLMLNE